MSVVVNAAQVRKGLGLAIKNFEKKFKRRNRRILTEAMRRIIARTPVHTGQTVRNYVASVGRPSRAGVKPGYTPVEPTNRLPLGSEQLRGRAEAEAMASVRAVNFNKPYEKFYITNRSPAAAGLEAGALPGEPMRSRSPNGMIGITMIEIRELIRRGAI